MAKPGVVAREEFNQWVHDGLNHLYDSGTLDKLPLLDVLLDPAQQTGSRSQELRRIILSAIQSLKPPKSAPIQSPDWRGYQILEQRFISGLAPSEVMARMNISRSLFFMEQARMVKRLTDLLWEKVLPSPEPQPQPEPEPGEVVDGQAAQLLEKATFTSVPLGPLLQSLYPVILSLVKGRRIDIALDNLADSSRTPHLPHADRVLLRQVLISLFAELSTLVSGGEIRLALFDEAQRYGIRIQANPGEPDPNLIIMGDRQGLSPETCRELIHAMRGELSAGMTETGGFEAVLEWRKEQPARSLLLIDDQPDLGDLFCRYLEGMEWKVTQVYGAQEARDVLAFALPDLILLDVILPREDGWEFLVELKGSPAFHSIPVIVCSAVNEPDLVRSLGADGYLPKPTSRAGLVQALRSYS